MRLLTCKVNPKSLNCWSTVGWSVRNHRRQVLQAHSQTGTITLTEINDQHVFPMTIHNLTVSKMTSLGSLKRIHAKYRLGQKACHFTFVHIFINYWPIFTRESSYCFQRVLAIAILSVRLSVTWVDQSKTMQARITKSSPSAAWKTLVSGTVKLFHKFEGGHPERGC